MEPKGLELKPLAKNAIKAWGKSAVPRHQWPGWCVQPLKLAGAAAEDKIGRLQQRLAADGQDAVVLTLPELDLLAVQHSRQRRGANPVVLAFAIVPVKGKPVFIDRRQLRCQHPKAHYRRCAGFHHRRS